MSKIEEVAEQNRVTMLDIAAATATRVVMQDNDGNVLLALPPRVVRALYGVLTRVELRPHAAPTQYDYSLGGLRAMLSWQIGEDDRAVRDEWYGRGVVSPPPNDGMAF